MGSFSKCVSFGTLYTIILCIISISALVSSQVVNRGHNGKTLRSSSSSQNQTIIDDVYVTKQIMKRAGDFASRALWVRKGKFILPTGTVLTIAPKVTIPAFRRRAFGGGLNSDIQATWFLYINADKMGITDPMHPFPFDRPPFWPFSDHMRPIEGKDEKKDKDKQPAGGAQQQQQQQRPLTPIGAGPLSDGPLGPDYPPPYDSQPQQDFVRNLKRDMVYTFFPIIQKRNGEGTPKENQQQPHKIGAGAKRHLRKARSVMSLPPPDKLPGGERAILLPSIENMMSNMGFEGRGCMLRAICEIHEFPLQEGYGLLGEMIALFFSISQSPYAESHMPEYLKAEEMGRNGDCSAYKSVCGKSIFKWEVKRKHFDDDLETNEIPAVTSPYRSKFEDDEL